MLLYTSRLQVLAIGTQCAVSHLEEYSYFYTMQETQASVLLRCGGLQRCSFMSLMALAQVKALHVSEDASHDFSHQKNFNYNPWDHLLVHLTSLMFLGDLASFLSGSSGYLLAPTILMLYMCPAILSSIYIRISYYKISKSKYNVQDSL